MSLHDEIHEQPAVLRHLLSHGWEAAQRVAAAIRQHDVQYVYLAARGTSEHAGTYGQYLLGAHNQLPVALAAPSLFTIYQRPPRLERALVIGVSQSGQSPDIVAVVAEGRRQGALTLAITNDSASPLAQAAAYHLDISAGAERAVAATKSYTAQLMTFALLSAALSADPAQHAALAAVPGAVADALAREAEVAQAAQRYTFARSCVVLGRGYNLASALEWSLKLKELTYIVAERYSTAEFRHGPIALVEPNFPVLAVAPQDAGFAEMLALLRRLTQEQGADLLTISDHDEALALADVGLRLAGGLPPWLTPLAAIVPAQLFCYHLTLARGSDPAAPRGLSKVTKTI